MIKITLETLDGHLIHIKYLIKDSNNPDQIIRFPIRKVRDAWIDDKPRKMKVIKTRDYRFVGHNVDPFYNLVYQEIEQ